MGGVIFEERAGLAGPPGSEELSAAGSAGDGTVIAAAGGSCLSPRSQMASAQPTSKSPRVATATQRNRTTGDTWSFPGPVAGASESCFIAA